MRQFPASANFRAGAPRAHLEGVLVLVANLRYVGRELSAMPHSRFVVELYLRHVEDLSARLKRLFPDQFADARSTLDQNVAWMKTAFATRYRAE